MDECLSIKGPHFTPPFLAFFERYVHQICIAAPQKSHRIPVIGQKC